MILSRYKYHVEDGARFGIASKLFGTRRAHIGPIYPHDRVSYFSLAISHEDYLRISAFEEELSF